MNRKKKWQWDFPSTEEELDRLDEEFREWVEENMVFHTWTGGGAHRFEDGVCVQCGVEESELDRWPGMTCSAGQFEIEDGAGSLGFGDSGLFESMAAPASADMNAVLMRVQSMGKTQDPEMHALLARVCGIGSGVGVGSGSEGEDEPA
jgi:hypothetical protein